MYITEFIIIPNRKLDSLIMIFFLCTRPIRFTGVFCNAITNSFS